MLTLFHSPNTRSTRVVVLLRELDALDDVRIEIVTVPRVDGTGGRDARNPHPEGKVPVLVHDDVTVWESAAIMVHIADLFPARGLNVPVGDRQRGAYLSWFAWYAGVVEPTMVLEAAKLQHPFLEATFRGTGEVKARLAATLADKPFLLGETFTAADLLLHSPYAWFGKPGEPAIDAWVDRCMARPGAAFAREFDVKHALK